MFPPPQPWKILAAADPDRTYLALASRFSLRSFRRLPAFLGYGQRIAKQVETAPGALGADFFRRDFYTLSAWESEALLRAFVRAMPHEASMRVFHDDMRAPSPFIRWAVKGSALPLSWPDALARLATPPGTASGRP